ncbi:MAG: ParB/RepB/Spo0J family partition protein [Alphaproteobacteria bacterium]|nr:ParB/RepB/Spo0J family partition protein [Alphaproteobacteria bacterium]
MNDKSARLGRGLAALIGDLAPVEAPAAPEAGGIRRIAVDAIVPNRSNPRRDFDTDLLDELAASIKEKGVMQPLLVRSAADKPGGFELIAGERRWRAAQRAGLHEVPVIVREVDDREALELAIIENVQRADLNPLEEALGYDQLLQHFDYTQNDLGHVIGKSRSHVANTLRLLKLPDDVRAMLSRGELTAGHARTLITAEDPSGLARRIVAEGLSVRQAETLMQARSGKADAPRRAMAEKDADTIGLEKRLADALGLGVVITHGDRGGRIEIRYSTLEQLDDLCRRFGVSG